VSGIVPASLWEAIDAYDAGLAAASPAELTGAGSAGYYLRQAALETAIAQRMTARAAASIHYGLLAGATLAQIADATGMSSAQVAACWRAWADGQRRLEQRFAGLGMSEREYQRAAAAAGEGAAADAGAGCLTGCGHADGTTQIGSPHP
jgi:hypothetical protein